MADPDLPIIKRFQPIRRLNSALGIVNQGEPARVSTITLPVQVINDNAFPVLVRNNVAQKTSNITTGSSPSTIYTPTANLRGYILKIIISSTVAGDYVVRNGAGDTNVLFQDNIGTATWDSMQIDFPNPVQITDGTSVTMEWPGLAGNARWTVIFYEEDPTLL